MTTVTIPKNEYRDLVDAKLRYEYLRQIMETDVFSPPPAKNRTAVIKALKETGKYNQKFLRSIAKGLRRSSYFK